MALYLINPLNAGSVSTLNQPRDGGTIGGYMKKTYTTPTLVDNGDAIEQTRGGERIDDENADPLTKDPMPGSIGYYL
jgi:hypothetical protein